MVIAGSALLVLGVLWVVPRTAGAGRAGAGPDGAGADGAGRAAAARTGAGSTDRDTTLPGFPPPLAGSTGPGPAVPAPAGSRSGEGAPSPGTPRPATSGVPAPYVQPFAQQPGAVVAPPLPSPTAAYPVAPHVDGCDRNYGTRNQCVPLTLPPGTTDGCGWLAEHGLAPLPVVGVDHRGLDANRDGVACGVGDR